MRGTSPGPGPSGIRATRRGRRTALAAGLVLALLGWADVPAGALDSAVGPVAPPVLVPLWGGSAPTVALVGPGSGSAAPSAAEPTSAPDAGQGAGLDPAAVADALSPLLSGGALGPGAVPAHVVDVASGQVLYAAADTPTVPASTMKLVTAASVLDSLGPDAVLQTRTAILNPAATTARVVLIGGGDPSLRTKGSRVGGSGTSLTPASLRELAQSTARALGARGIEAVRIGYDDSLFVGPAVHPSWSASFPAAGVVAPVSALQVDQGRRSPGGAARVANPARWAADAFAEQLEELGLEVRGTVKSVQERADSVRLASVRSPTVGVLVERMLATSDNDYAEALARLGALAAGEEASFDGVAVRAAEVLASLGIDAHEDAFADGSGLSRANALAPRTLTALLRVASQRFGEIASGLPVAGATGSLRVRFAAPGTRAARGVVRAKTGTLTGVIGLAGYASRPDGRLLAFAFLDQSMPGGAIAGRRAVDRAAAALVRCDCAPD